MNQVSSTLDYIDQSIIMKESKDDLMDNLGMAVGIYVIFMIISLFANIIPFGSFVILGPLTLGMAIVGMRIVRQQELNIENMFDGFKQFGDALVAFLLIGILVFFGVILFIVPGIILALGLSMTMYIVAEEPHLGATDAMKRSWELMDGYKVDYFILGLKFMGLALLCILTLGIGFLFLFPYVQITTARYFLILNRIKGYGEQEEGDDILNNLI